MPREQPHFAVVDQAVSTMRQVQQYINVGMETAIDVVMDFVENNKDNDRQVGELKSIMLEYVEMERDLEQFLAAVDHTKSQALECGDVTRLEASLDEKLADLQKDNQPGDLLQHEKYRDLEQKIIEMQHPEEAAPPSLPMPSTTDEDICMTQEKINTKCPYTGLEMKSPVRNKLCNHNYDKEGIQEYINNRGKKAKCPVSGCANTKPIEMSDLEEHKELRRYIERLNRQAGKRTKRSNKDINV